MDCHEAHVSPSCEEVDNDNERDSESDEGDLDA